MLNLPETKFISIYINSTQLNNMYNTVSITECNILGWEIYYLRIIIEH